MANVLLRDIVVSKFEVLRSRRSGFNPRLSHSKDEKNVLDAPLLSTQHFKVRVKSKVEQSRERSSALPYSSV